MSSIEQAIKEAVDQGYQPNVERYPEMEGISPLQIAMAMQADVFIDPAFWKALGKKRGWTTDDDFKYWQKSVVEWEEKYWKKFWHRFIDHLAEGKDAESFFQSLDSKARERPDSHHWRCRPRASTSTLSPSMILGRSSTAWGRISNSTPARCRVRS